jgi:hypothetical protein
MSVSERLSERLDKFLASRAMSRETVLASLDEPFGRPLLVVAAGSILQGVGNARSDLDIIVVVERKVSRLPLASYAQSVLIDPKYFDVAEAEGWASAIRDSSWPSVGHIELEQWGQRWERLLYATRFAYGLPLLARDGWDRWMDVFREPWLIAQVCQWWHVEAVRRRIAARWLIGRKPMLAAQRQLEAVLAVLESRAAAAGHHFFGPKWLSEKLRAMDDTEGLAMLGAIMRGPTREAEVAAYIERCEALLDTLGISGDDHGLIAYLSYLPGTQVEERDGQIVVSRGNLRSVACRDTAATRHDPGAPLWQGGIAAHPPPALLSLFAADMLWVSIGARPA